MLVTQPLISLLICLNCCVCYRVCSKRNRASLKIMADSVL